MQKLAAEIGKATVDVESAMLATTTPDDLIEQVKEHLLYFRELAGAAMCRTRQPSCQPA